MNEIMIIKCDINDGDYITETINITDNNCNVINTFISIINHIIAQGDKYKQAPESSWIHGIKWPHGETSKDYELETMYGDLLSQDEIDIVCETVPYGDYGIHTIESIRIIKISEEKELLK